MDVKIVLTSLVLFYLDVVCSVTQQCTSKLILCTKMMSKMVAAIEDKSAFCQILNNYFNCIETNCNGFLSPCETNNYRNRMLSTWTSCSAYVTPLSLECIHELSAAASASTPRHFIFLTTAILCLVFIKLHFVR